MSMGGTGCSFMFAKKAPPQYKTMAAFDCTEGKTLPVLDVLLASLQPARAQASGRPPPFCNARHEARTCVMTAHCWRPERVSGRDALAVLRL
jgi:hypothetical protein